MYIGTYEIERLLGSGGFANVYLGHKHNKPFAIKALTINSNLNSIKIMSREYECLRSLNHPNIVNVHTYGKDSNCHYYSMEYLSGHNGKIIAERLQRLPANERHQTIIHIGVQVLDALAHLHSRNWLHLDIKPSNIMVESENRTKIIDFGTVNKPTRFNSKKLIGTPRYASPEQINGQRLDHRSDLFSLGATLYFLLLNRPPFSNRDRSHFDKPSLIDPSVPPNLEDILMKMLELNPQDRYNSANEVIDDLTKVNPSSKPIAGREGIIRQIALCLRRVLKGEQIHLHLNGTNGSGKRWVKQTIFEAANQHKISVFEFSSDNERTTILEAISLRNPMIVVTINPFKSSIGLPEVQIDIRWLTLAHIRRTLFSLAPRTNSLAILSEKLHRLTRGLPALMLPLIEQYTVDGFFSLPNPPPIFPEHTQIAQLSKSDLLILQILSHLNMPCSLEILEGICPLSPESALVMLSQNSWVYSQGNHWQIGNQWLQEHIQQSYPTSPEALNHWMTISNKYSQDIPINLKCIEELSLSGNMGLAKIQGEALLNTLPRSKQAHCLLVMGQVYLDIGMIYPASEILAESTALSKAYNLHSIYQRSQALRARCSLEKHHSSPTGATHALDRLNTLIHTRNPWILSTWQWACGALGDSNTWKKWLPISLDVCQNSSPMVRFRCLFSIVRGACALGEFQTAQTIINDITPKIGESYELLRWEYTRVNSILNDLPPPVTGSLAYHLSAEEILLLKRRWIRVKGKNPDPTWHH